MGLPNTFSAMLAKPLRCGITCYWNILSEAIMYQILPWTVCPMYCKAMRTCPSPGICRTATDYETPGLVACRAFCKFPGRGMSEQLCNKRLLIGDITNILCLNHAGHHSNCAAIWIPCSTRVTRQPQRYPHAAWSLHAILRSTIGKESLLSFLPWTPLSP